MDEIYLNGDFISKSEAQISIMDRGFLFGDGVYELIPVYNKKPFLLDKHLKRLKDSLTLIGMDEIKEIDKSIKTLINKCSHSNFFIYLHITRGSQPQRNHIYPSNIAPTVLIMCEDYPCFSEEKIKKGFTASLQDDFRWMKSNIKSISLLGNVLLKNYASQNGFYETLLIRNNKLTEGSASNVFMVKDGKVYTPKLGSELLPGVTRDLLIMLMKENNLDIIESDISQTNLVESDEIWCSSSTNAVVPIIKVDDKLINEGVVGKISMDVFNLATKFIDNF